MYKKKIYLLIIFISLAEFSYAQKRVTISSNFKKDIANYKKNWGDSYKNQVYVYDGSLSVYKKIQNELIKSELQIEYMSLVGKYPKKKPLKTAIKDRSKNPYKIPVTVHILDLWQISFPLNFDLSMNMENLIELYVHEGFTENKDSIMLDFSKFSKLQVLAFYYPLENCEPFPYTILIPPTNLHFLSFMIPSSNIVSLPETLEKLEVGRDVVFLDSIFLLPNLWNVSIYFGDNYIPLSQNIINIPQLKNLTVDTFSFVDVDRLIQRSHLDTLTLCVDDSIILPDNFKRLTNISVIKLFFGPNFKIWKKETAAKKMQYLLPNAEILYNEKICGKDTIVKYKERK